MPTRAAAFCSKARTASLSFLVLTGCGKSLCEQAGPTPIPTYLTVVDVASSAPICDATVTVIGPLLTSPDASSALVAVSDAGGPCQYDYASRLADGAVWTAGPLAEEGQYEAVVSRTGFVTRKVDFQVGYYTAGCDPTPPPNDVTVALMPQQ